MLPTSIQGGLCGHGVISNLFHGGDRIRLDISSSDFSQFDPNPNTN
jgi:predicted acyl esterase